MLTVEPLERLLVGADRRDADQVDHVLALGDEDAGQIEVEERDQRLPPLLRRERVQIGDLGLSQNMKPVGGKAAGIPGQCETRAGHFGSGDLAVESQVAGQRLQLQRVAASRIRRASSLGAPNFVASRARSTWTSSSGEAPDSEAARSSFSSNSTLSTDWIVENAGVAFRGPFELAYAANLFYTLVTHRDVFATDEQKQMITGHVSVFQDGKPIGEMTPSTPALATRMSSLP